MSKRKPVRRHRQGRTRRRRAATVARRAARAAATSVVPPPPTAPAASQVELRGLPIVAELARVARGPGSPRVKLEGAMEVLFGAYGESDLDFSGMFLGGWVRARHDKQFRLTLAWQREQIRLSIEDILVEGARTRAFRADLDAGAVAAVIVGAAEGCLLQAATDGGAVSADQLVRTLLRLALSEA